MLEAIAPTSSSLFVKWKKQHPFYTLAKEEITLYCLPQDIDIPEFIAKRKSLLHSSSWRNSLASSTPKQLRLGQLAFVQKNTLIALHPFQIIETPLESMNNSLDKTTQTLAHF